MKYRVSTFKTPAGPFSLAVDDTGAVRATAFGNMEALQPYVSAGELVPDGGATRLAREQVLAYFAGNRKEFDLALAPDGTAFQHRVWEALRRVGYGHTTTYGELARELHTSPRAVGGANGANPICLIIPCHRVIGSTGALTGFAFGEGIKRWLLEHEAARCVRTISSAVMGRLQRHRSAFIRIAGLRPAPRRRP